MNDNNVPAISRRQALKSAAAITVGAAALARTNSTSGTEPDTRSPLRAAADRTLIRRENERPGAHQEAL